MKEQDQIKAIAELDGYVGETFGITDFCGEQLYSAYRNGGPNAPLAIPNYLTSYDAIIPVIHNKLNRHTCHSFFDALGLIAIIDWQDFDGVPSYEGDGSYFELWVLFKATPSQLSEALLRATGKWIE